jgi:hypothetical protein
MNDAKRNPGLPEGPAMSVSDPLRIARDLHAGLRRYPWYASVGRHGDTISVYVRWMPVGDERRAIPSRVEGLPVAIRYHRNPEPSIKE